MRLIFSTKREELINAVNNFKIGQSKEDDDVEEKEVDSDDSGSDDTKVKEDKGLLDLVMSFENCSVSRKASVNETDFVLTLYNYIIPALHCRHLLAMSKDFIDLDADFASQSSQDNLMWVLLFFTQGIHNNSQEWKAEVKPPSQLVNNKITDLMGIAR